MEISSQTLNLREKSIGFYASNSLLVHALIIAAFVISSLYFNGLISERKKYNMKLVESSVRVDLVAMPSMTIKELKSLEKLAAGKPKVEVIAEPEPKTPKVEVETKGPEFIKKVKKLSFAEMMKGYSKKKLPKAKVTKSNVKKNKAKAGIGGLSRSERLALANLVKEGNRLKKGSSLTATGIGSSDNGTFHTYMEQARDWVKREWKLPTYLRDKDLSCQIQIFVNSSGKLLKTEIYKSSGNKEFDERAVAAVKASNPLPGYANEIKSRVVGGEIVLAFPL